MRPIRYRYAYSDDYISCYRYNKVDTLTCKQTNIICNNNYIIFYIKSILHVRPPIKQTKYIMLCYHNDCFSLTKKIYILINIYWYIFKLFVINLAESSLLLYEIITLGALLKCKYT